MEREFVNEDSGATPEGTRSEGSDDDVSLGFGWSAALERRPRGATLRLRHPERGSIAVQITMGADGPIIKTTAAALELEATDEIVARCDRFTVEARQQVTLRAPVVELDATLGDVRIHANDDVRVKGEQILLNCDEAEPLPSWLPAPPSPPVTLPRQDTLGDPTLFDGSGGGHDDGAATK